MMNAHRHLLPLRSLLAITLIANGCPAILLLFASPLLAQSNDFQVGNQLAAVDHRLNIVGTHLQIFPAADELDADVFTKIQPVADGRLERLKRIGDQPFPITFSGGLAIDGGFSNASNVAITYGFSKGIKMSGYRNLYKSFYLYPELTFGFLAINREQLPEPKNEGGIYGMIEGHRHWGRENLSADIFLGLGAGAYEVGREEFSEEGATSGFIKESGIGVVVSAGVQVRTRVLMGGLHIYRSPGLGEFVTLANVGYQPRNYKSALMLGMGSFAILVLLALLIPGN